MEKRTVLLFAGAADLAAADSLAVNVPTPATAAGVLAAIAAQVPQLAALLPACRLAVDHQFVTAEFPLPAHAELALIPPVSGG